MASMKSILAPLITSFDLPVAVFYGTRNFDFLLLQSLGACIEYYRVTPYNPSNPRVFSQREASRN